LVGVVLVTDTFVTGLFATTGYLAVTAVGSEVVWTERVWAPVGVEAVVTPPS
jgi:hypothetical protein